MNGPMDGFGPEELEFLIVQLREQMAELDEEIDAMQTSRGLVRRELEEAQAELRRREAAERQKLAEWNAINAAVQP